MSSGTDGFTGPIAAAVRRLGPTADLVAAPERCLPVPPAADRRIWAAEALDEVTLRALRERAQADLGSPWPAAPARAYARYFRDGDRVEYEQAVAARQHRLSRAAVMAAVTLDTAWLDEVADGVTLLCEQSSWCWPAHDDTYRVHGAVVPTVSDPYLDLGAGEVAAQLAWTDQLLGEQLDRRVPGLRARIRHEVRRRVLTPFAERRDWHWLGLDGRPHNWNPWIHGNVLICALRLVDDTQDRAHLLDLVIEGLDRYLVALPADGAIDEGYGYWWNGACRLLEALEVLEYATGSALSVFTHDALRNTVAYPHRMHLGAAWYLNVADCPARPTESQPWDALHRAALRVGDEQARAHAASHRTPGEPTAHEQQGLGRLLRALTDPAWHSAEPQAPPLPREVWFASTQVMLARQQAGSARGLTLAVKGGHNDEHHNHNDVGSFVIALNGVPVLVDPGRPTYTARTFGPDRYEIWTMRSDWHNVPQVRGTAQSHGRRYAARDVTVALADSACELALDLAAAYPRGDVRRWWRTARLERTTGRVTVRDTWQLDEPQAPDEPYASSRIHLVAAGEVTVGDGRAAIRALDGAGTVSVSWHPAHAPCTATVRELDDPMLREVWGDRLTRLEIDVAALGPAATLELAVEETP